MGRVYVSEVPRDIVHVYNSKGAEVATWDLNATLGHGISAGGIEFVAPDKILIATNNYVSVMNTS